MKRGLLVLLISWNSLLAQKSSFDDAKYQQGKVYIIARGTKSKQGFISKSFNSTDSNITHIGLGYYEPLISRLKIYNISTEKKRKNALCVETVEDFIFPKDVFYAGLWEMKLNQKQFSKFKQLLVQWENKKVTFDYDFDLHNADSSLYCSEFCWRILKEVDREEFHFVPVTKLLPNSFYKNVLGKDSLNYIPVDFFLSFSRLKKVKELSFPHSIF